MSEATATNIKKSFWIIAGVALVWNLFGVMNFFMQMTADPATLPEKHRAIIESRPIWSTAAFALAVFGGALGCLLLLLRKSAATNVLIASLVGVVVGAVPMLGMAGEFSIFENFMYLLMPAVVGAALVWYSKQAEKRGWIS